jgi:hypothetical protein
VQRSSELEEKFVALEGQIAANAKAARAADASRSALDPAQATYDERLKLAGEIERIEEERKSLAKQFEILSAEKERLTITSPIDGKVVTWRVRELLEDRPVNAGTSIMEVADPATAWEVQIEVPEAKMGHVNRHLRVIREQDPDAQLEVTFILATHTNPEDKLRGKVTNIHTSAEVNGEEGSTVRMTVAFDQQELLKIVETSKDDGKSAAAASAASAEQVLAQLKSNLKVGADVKAKIHCGREPVGYVLFHELWEFVQSRILFRF